MTVARGKMLIKFHPGSGSVGKLSGAKLLEA